MRERQTSNGNSQTINSMYQDRGLIVSCACEIRICPKLIKHRIVKPLVVAIAVQIEQSGSSSDAKHVSYMLVSQSDVRQHSDRGDKNCARQKNQSVNPNVGQQVDRCVIS